MELKVEDGVYLLAPFPFSGNTKRDWAISSAGIWTEKMGDDPIPSLNSSGHDGNSILKMTEADAVFECSLLTGHCVSLS